MSAKLDDVAGKSFDYIIIGGGTAGLALAARLSEDPSISVLVLEAGEANLNDSVNLLPMQRRKQLNNPKYDWAFKTVEQPHSNNRTYAWPRGKGLGGSSAINFMLWNKPAREYVQAFELLGNPGWTWELFDKYSKRAEKFIPPDHDTDVLTYDLAYRGRTGAIITSFPSVISNLERPLIQAMKKLGIEHILDSSSGFTNGSCVTASTLDPATHTRSYAGNMYFAPAAARPNLIVLVTAHVTRIVTRTNDDGSITAMGVEFLFGGRRARAQCVKEIVLCAGTIMSPQILELSGIGDPEVLRKAGVEVKLELPGVGANVQEHLYSGVSYEVVESVVDGHEVHTFDALMNPDEAQKHFALHSSGKGSLNLNTIGLTFVPLDTICADSRTVQRTLTETIRAGIAAGTFPAGLRKQYELQLEHLAQKVPSLEIVLGPGLIAPSGVPDPNKKKHVSLCFGLNAPFSRGTIHIASNDPLAQPVIDPHVFEQPYDLRSMVELVKFNRRLAKTEPLKSIFAEKEVYPGPQVETDEQIAEWLKGAVGTTFHTVGTCSMLPLEDGGVVDHRLKVHKTTNIRVVDASIIPLHIGSHTQAMVYALGEQAADIIKGVI